MKKSEKLLLVAVIIIGIIIIIQNFTDNKTSANVEDNKNVTDQTDDSSDEKNNSLDNNATYLVTGTEDLVFGKVGGSEHVSIDTDADSWEIVSVPLWLSATKNDNSLNVTCQHNHSGDNRDDHITIKAGSLSAVIFVSQTAVPKKLSLSQSEFSLPRSGGNFSVEIDTDADDWTAECYSNVPSLSASGNSLDVSFPYLDGPSTTWTIEIKVNYNGSTVLRQYVKVKQKGYCYACQGKGQIPCGMCNGTGHEFDYSSLYPMILPCSYCKGNGYFKCTACDGTGDSK